MAQKDGEVEVILLSKPLTLEQLKEQADEDNYVSGVVLVDLSDAIDNDLEGWLDLLSEKLTGSPLLMDINYRVVGQRDNELKIEVTGDVSGIIDCEES